MSDTYKDRKGKKALGPSAEAFLASGKGKVRKSDGNGKSSPKWGRNYRVLRDWNHMDLSHRVEKPGLMKLSRYRLRHGVSPEYRLMQAAYAEVPLR